MISQVNQYAGIARNVGIEASSGDYIHFMDADDYLYDGIYKKNLDFLEDNRTVDYLKLRATSFSLGDNEEGKNEFYTLDYLSEDDFEKKVDLDTNYDDLIIKSYRAPWGGVYRHDLLSDIRFSSLPCVEDREFYIQVVTKATNIVYFSQYAVHHQLDNPDSIMGRAKSNYYAYLQAYNDVKTAITKVDVSNKVGILKNELKCVLDAFIVLEQASYEKEIPLLHAFLADLDWSAVNRWCHPCMNQINDVVLRGVVKTGEIEEIIRLLRSFKHVYVYGAGHYGTIFSEVFES